MDKKTQSPTKKDFKNTWRLYKENYKAFISTELFAIFCLIIIGAILILFAYIIDGVLNVPSRGNPITIISDNFTLSIIYRVVNISAVVVILFGFMNCQYGLSYDIMSSGDMFAEFKNSKTYFKRFWWQYIAGSIIQIIGILIPVIITIAIYSDYHSNISSEETEIYFTGSASGDNIFYICWIIWAFIWEIYIINIFPSITNQGSLIRAFIESWRIFKGNFKRIIKTWLLYHLFFTLPSIIMLFIENVISNLVFQIIFLFLHLAFIFVGYPMMTLLATGIYNNTDFKRYKPLDYDDEKDLKKSQDEGKITGDNKEE